MDVLVAGCGWLGRAVALALARRGDRVVATRRDAAAIADLTEHGIDVRAVDLLDARALETLAIRFEAVVACQAASARSVEAYRDAYVDANRALARLVVGAGRLVYTGSTGVFGQDDGSTVDETSTPRPRGPSAGALAEGESIVREAGCVVRLSGLYGPGRWGVIDRVERGALALGPGDHVWMNFCHLEDATRTVLAAVDRGRIGAIYHGTDAHPTRRADVVGWIAGRLGIDPPRSHDPAPGGRAHRRVDGRRSRAELGIELAFPSFRDGLAERLAASR